jgi:transcriptional regulator with XRE-family HTH domain
MMGSDLKKLLRARRVKSKDLAEHLHVSPVTVSRWCTGRQTPDRLTQQAIQLWMDGFDTTSSKIELEEARLARVLALDALHSATEKLAEANRRIAELTGES